MARWAPLHERLASVEDRTTLTWAELDRLVDGLPPSAYQYPAFWAGDRSSWTGFATTDVHVGRSVTFVRRAGTTAHPNRTAPSTGVEAPADVVLVGCVKRKLDHPAPARDLYVSALFRRACAYAEASTAAWFVLSAQHGLVQPDTVLAPYDLRLSQTPTAYRAAWGSQVVAQLETTVGPLAGKVVEIHAGAAYTNAIRDRLQHLGVIVVEPLPGLTLGQRLAWYAGTQAHLAAVGDRAEPSPTSSEVALGTDVSDVVSRLTQHDKAATPADFLGSARADLRLLGLYSWWVDANGASDLSTGLGLPLSAGLIYAGQAGATRTRSGRRSGNTLWGRITGMHLGGRYRFSTFRRSLGSVLAAAAGADEIDESALTLWMHQHLHVIAIPVEDADRLDDLESAVLTALDPPLTLAKMPPSPTRARLTALATPIRPPAKAWRTSGRSSG